MVFIIHVEGNIGAGKSTILESLIKQENVKIYTENIKKWKKLLSLIKKDPKKYFYELEITILDHYRSIYEDINKLIKYQKQIKYIIIERSAHSAINIFCRIGLANNWLTHDQFNYLEQLYKQIQIKNAHFILIDTSPMICNKRIIKRNRLCEINTTMKYLIELQILHKSIKYVAVIDGNLNKELVLNQFSLIMEKIQ